jgi:hypothetical protein
LVGLVKILGDLNMSKNIVHFENFIRYLRTYISDITNIKNKILLESVEKYSYTNIQFYLALKSRSLDDLFYLTFKNLNKSLLDEFLANASINVLGEEEKFVTCRYPQNLFINSLDDLDHLIFSMFKQNQNQKNQIRNLKDVNFFCIGSCFATNIAIELKKNKSKCSATVLAEAINSPRNNLDLFKFFFSGERNGLLLDSSFIDNDELNSAKYSFYKSDTLILTLGCAYTLLSEENLPIKKPTINSKFDCPELEDIIDQLKLIIIICDHYQDIFISVSPVPLAGTLHSHGNPFYSDMCSKSLLHVALSRVINENPKIKYIPSFEIFRQLSIHSSFPFFGMMDGNSRHPDTRITGLVVKNFIKANYIF